MEDGLNNYKIQSLWIGGELSKVEQLCIQSFLDHGHEFHLYTYETVSNLPPKTQIFDAGSILPKEKIFTFDTGWGKGSVAGFADYFRLLLLQRNGGWWTDMDVVCLKPFDFAREIVFCSSTEGEYGSLANNSVFKVPKNAPFLDHCIHRLSLGDISKMTYGSAGPFLFQSVIKELQLEDQIVPYHYFNPISWRYVGELILDQMTRADKIKEYVRPFLKPHTMPGRRIVKASYAVHFWNEIWRSSRFDKNARYSASCLFEQLKRKHGIK
ncbi:glycosyltransferase [Mucilaginibacter sabulilitoris]|uniref:Glycosyltransferase n=1 Tax=Mucilaginibacter sabulilitoris TaxID=1173583 RepID=A0ABZ0TIW4_9SPHI|nr:glycosyltransferase [Mucilaginibacter sabulilitoris]WPU91654.1 glycosyltransferase [Mucilaginibacter sabulilitoris]